jgi:hypothetical protein
VRISLVNDKEKNSSFFKKKCLKLNDSDPKIRKNLLKKEYEMSDKNSLFSKDDVDRSYENYHSRGNRESERSNKNETGKIYSNFPTKISDSDIANNYKIQNIQNYNNYRLSVEKTATPEIGNLYSHNQFNGNIPTPKNAYKNFNPNNTPIIRIDHTEISSNSDIEPLLVTSETDKFYKNKRQNYTENNFNKLNNMPYFRPNLNSNSPEEKYLDPYYKETSNKYQINSNQTSYKNRNIDYREEYPNEVYSNKKYFNHKKMLFPCEVVDNDNLNLNNTHNQYVYRSDSLREIPRYDSSKYAYDFLNNNIESNFNKIKEDGSFPSINKYSLFSFHPKTEAHLPTHLMSNYKNEDLNNIEKNYFKQPSIITTPKMKHSEIPCIKSEMESSSLRIPLIKHKSSTSNLHNFFK